MRKLSENTLLARKLPLNPGSVASLGGQAMGFCKLLRDRYSRDFKWDIFSCQTESINI